MNNNNYFYSLPHDIIQYINDINYNYYAQIIQKNWLLHINNKKYQRNTILIFNKYYDSNIDNINNYYNNFIIENFSLFKKIVNTCNNCNCCKKHTINRPKTLEYFNDFKYRISGSYRQTFYMKNNCTCPCRHLSRKICDKYSINYI